MMARKRFDTNGVTIKVDPKFKEYIRNFAKRNNLSVRQASIKLTKFCNSNAKKKFPDEIIF